MKLIAKNDTWLFIDILELLELYRDSLLKLKHTKIGESLIIYESKVKDFHISILPMDSPYNKLSKTNKLLRQLLSENEAYLKQIASDQGVFRSSKNDGLYRP